MKLFNRAIIIVMMVSVFAFGQDPNVIYEDFEYASVSGLQSAGWDLTYGEVGFEGRMSVSNQMSLQLGRESNSAIVKELEPFVDSNDVSLSLWVNADAPEDVEKCASRLYFTVYDEADNFATIRVGAAARGSRTLDVRYNYTGNVTWNFPSPGIRPQGWNKLTFDVDESGLISMYFNQTLLGTCDQLGTISKVKLWTPLEFLGNRSGGAYVDAFVYSPGYFDNSSCGGSDNLYQKEDFDQDCDIDIDDLVSLASVWLFEADYPWTEYAYLTGTIQGVDGLELGSMIGIDILDENDNKRTYTGEYDETTPYQGNIIWMNRWDELPDSDTILAFNGTEWSLGPIAIPKNQTWSLWVEAYPKSYSTDGASQTTDLSTYSRTHWHGIQLSHGQTKHIDIEMPLSSEAASISGTLTQNGQPVANTLVHLWGWGVVNGAYDSVQTDANGHFNHTHISGWGKNPSDPTQIISPTNVALMANGEIQVIVHGVDPNETITGVDIELMDDLYEIYP